MEGSFSNKLRGHRFVSDSIVQAKFALSEGPDGERLLGGLCPIYRRHRSGQTTAPIIQTNELK